MKIESKYIVVKTLPDRPEKRIVASDGNGAVFDFTARLAEDGAEYWLDVERFIGRDVVFTADGDPYTPVFSDNVKPAPACRTSYRPYSHFTTEYGWINDPNGLSYYNGRYHLFCQHNPVGTRWGNMHWAHAVSDDLLSWEYLGDCLFPDGLGTMYSGSAVVDFENRSGLGTADRPPLILFYTSAGNGSIVSAGKGYTQCIAYSADGVHFEKYANNPVIPELAGRNRDPKVIFVPELGAYLMALYLENNEFCFLKSVNLLKWEEFQRITLPDARECPDIYPLTDPDGNVKYVFSAASDNYYIGHFDASGFVPDGPERCFYRALAGCKSYAAQTFTGIKGRTVRISWEKMNTPDSECFFGQMSLPFEMFISRTADGEDVLAARLCRETERSLDYHPIEGGHATVPSPSYIARIRIGEDPVEATVDIDGLLLTLSSKDDAIRYGGGSVPLGTGTLLIIVDKLGVEILADDGRVFTSFEHAFPGGERCFGISGARAEISLMPKIFAE